MRRQRRGVKLLALILGLSLVAAACGGDDDDEGAEEGGATEEEAEGVQGGELVDLSAFAQGPAENIDPALSTTVSASQVGESLYDGLTQVDYSDIENPVVRGQVAESWESNEDATEWTFTIRDDLFFSDETQVLPSSFQRAWERATEPDFAGDYSYLFTFIEGGAEKLDGAADGISGVEANDDDMTLTITLSAPYANFDAVAGFKLFAPMPEAVEELTDQNEWETMEGGLIGNGPFMLDAPINDQEIVLVPNPEWDGTKYDEELGLPEQPFLDRITFRVSADEDTAYQAFEAGEGQVASFVAGRVQEAVDNYATTLDDPVLGIYFFGFNQENPIVGGEENKLLRQAISQAIDREEINDAVYEGTRTTATGITPPGIPGFEEGLCDYCAYDPEAAQEAYDEWQAAGNSLTEPLPIQLNADAGHEPVVQIIIDNLDAIGIPAVAEPIPSETYFGQLADGACVFCRFGWIADYPTYDNFTFDLFHTTALGGNNVGYTNPEFDELLDEAKQTTDPDEAADLFHQAEQVLLNDDIGTVPINWYLGEWVYNPDEVANLEMNPDLHIEWETVSLTG
jgi:ABC-type oligopeptide transport system substrate-binding subunit